MYSIHSDTIVYNNHVYANPGLFEFVTHNPRSDNSVQTGDTTNRNTSEILSAQKSQPQNDPIDLSGSGPPARKKTQESAGPSTLAKTGNQSKNTDSKQALVLDEEIIKTICQTTEKEEPCQKIHLDIPIRWNAWLKTDLKKEEKDEILKKYPRSGPCLLEAPKLYPEIKSALNDSALKRDKYFCTTQKLAGSSLLALAPLIILLLESKKIDSKKILSNIWDAAKIQAKLHHSQSVARQTYI